MGILGQLINALPGSISQGLIWGIMAIGVYITYRILDVADLTVDGSFATGGAVAVVLILKGYNLWLAMLIAFIAGLAAGAITGLLHTLMGIPPILAGILTQLSLYSINLKIMGKANQSVNVNQTDLLVSLRWVKEFAFHNPLITVGVVLVMVAMFFTDDDAIFKQADKRAETIGQQKSSNFTMDIDCDADILEAEEMVNLSSDGYSIGDDSGERLE